MAGEQHNSCLHELNETFFTQHGKHLSSFSLKKNMSFPFKDHAQFPLVVDILSRKEKHHAFLQVDFSKKIYVYYLEALLQYLTNENIPHPLRDADLIYIDLPLASFNQVKQKSIEKDFADLRTLLEVTEKYSLIVLSHPDLFAYSTEQGFIREQWESLLNHPKCRFLIFLNQQDTRLQHHLDLFDTASINAPSETDVIAILKQQRTDFENYHHVLIPEEILTYAYSLSERYLSASHTLEKALLLLDSCSARASAMDRGDPHSQSKSVVTFSMLTSVLSTWTQIPATHLQINKFKFSEFTQGMQLKVFGQEAAITILGHELQQAHAHLQHKPGPFCNLLFAGPNHSGKKTTAIALTEQLFKHPTVLYFAQSISPTVKSIIDIKLERYFDKRHFSLKEVVRETPYCVIVFEHVEQLPASVLDTLHEVMGTGHLYDESGNLYNFHHAILILSTTLGTNRLRDLSNALVEDEYESIDLIKLVMNEQKQQAFQGHHYTPEEIVDEIIPEITHALPSSLCQHLHVVPFTPLNRIAIEKVLRFKLRQLGNTLESRYSIELSYAPEVLRYLTHEIIRKQENENKNIDVDKALNHLYFSVEQTILSQADNKNRSNQLFLQLNETGQLIRCDWLALSTVGGVRY